MKKGYLFISNSNKPSLEIAENRNPIVLSSFSRWPVEYAIVHGYKVYMGINRNRPSELISGDGYDITFYDQHSYRSIFAIKDNWIAFKNLRGLLKTHPEIEFIHCNTPIGGLMGRICGKLYGVKTVVYTAHGFHFFKGAPLFNRTILKWMEQLMAHWTDAIISMNQEDYEAAQKFNIRNHGKVYYVPGVGVDTKSFNNIEVNREEIRKSIGVPTNAVMAIAMGDIVPRKNYRTAIEAVAKSNCPFLHYIICGRGTQIEELKKFADSLGIRDQIHFLGFRTDIKQLALASDLFLFSSLQEGLPRSTMEAMCAGLPCVISAIRGHVDLIEDKQGGYLCPVNDVDAYSIALRELVCDSDHRRRQGLIAKERVKNFDIEVVRQRINEIYDDILKNK